MAALLRAVLRMLLPRCQLRFVVAKARLVMQNMHHQARDGEKGAALGDACEEGAFVDIEHLHEFAVLARKLNYREAAAELRMSQSALSRHIASLETCYGTSLLVRDRHQVHLTEAGAYVLDHADTIWSLFCQSRENAKALFAGEHLLRCSGVLYYESAFRFAMDAERVMKRVDPHCRVRVERNADASLEAQMELLRAGQSDCAILFDAIERSEGCSDIRFERVFDVALEATVRAGHPLARERELTLDMLQDRRFLQLVGPDYSAHWQTIAALLERNGVSFSTKTVAAGSVYDLIASLGDIGDALYVTPFGSTSSIVRTNEDLVTLPICVDELHMHLDALYLSDRETDLTRLFVDSLNVVLEASLAEES